MVFCEGSSFDSLLFLLRPAIVQEVIESQDVIEQKTFFCYLRNKEMWNMDLFQEMSGVSLYKQLHKETCGIFIYCTVHVCSL